MAKNRMFVLPALILTVVTAEAWNVNAGFNGGSVSGSGDTAGALNTGFVPGVSLSADFFPGSGTVSLGPEISVLFVPLSGEGINASVLMFPAALRVAWHMKFLKVERLDIYLLGRAGVAPGIWLDAPPNAENPLGFVSGFAFGAKFFVTRVFGAFLEAGYSYYGFSAAASHDTARTVLEARLAAYAALGVSFALSDVSRPPDAIAARDGLSLWGFGAL
jgi:hypothetical protein